MHLQKCLGVGRRTWHVPRYATHQSQFCFFEFQRARFSKHKSVLLLPGIVVQLRSSDIVGQTPPRSAFDRWIVRDAAGKETSFVRQCLSDPGAETCNVENFNTCHRFESVPEFRGKGSACAENLNCSLVCSGFKTPPRHQELGTLSMISDQ